MVRPQYHLRPSPKGLLAWDVKRLIQLSQRLPVQPVPIQSVHEVDEPYWYASEGPAPTCHSILKHLDLIEKADLRFPIILDADGRLMDGMHRVCKAIMEGHSHIDAVQFTQTPEPDYVGIAEKDLPYK